MGCAYVHWEAWKGTIIRGWHLQVRVPRRLGRRKTFALWLTSFPGWYGRPDRTAPLNSSTSAGSNILASLRNKRSIGAGRLQYILTTSLACWKYSTRL